MQQGYGNTDEIAELVGSSKPGVGDAVRTAIGRACLMNLRCLFDAERGRQSRRRWRFSVSWFLTSSFRNGGCIDVGVDLDAPSAFHC